MTATLENVRTGSGYAFPLGATRSTVGVNFSLFCRHARKVVLGLFLPEEKAPYLEITLHPQSNRTGDIWHILVTAIPEGALYAYKIDNSDTWVIDPYAQGISTTNEWSPDKDYQPLGWVPVVQKFDWQNARRPNIPLKDLVIYEMHVRGFTQHPSSLVQYPGTFLGVIEKIPYLVELGVNAVELMPVFEFNEAEYSPLHPTREKLPNYWGYSTVNFFSPMQRYATSSSPAQAIQEFKQMVHELHRHGIEVILDVVYNHTSEGNEKGPDYCYKSLDEDIYYLKGDDGKFANYSGCGNTFNGNHPICWELILQSLRYWYSEMQVDGFRFDLASIHTRDIHGIPLANPPLIQAITEDPILSKCKLIAEPWDAVGLYQVGNFTTSKRWSEWNGVYRDSVRQFMRGEGQVGDFATRLAGSNDLYARRGPLASLNFITSHDGFSLRDLVSYDVKHNADNGEENRDGNPRNESWNCGVEGPTEDPQILALRERQMRNFHLALMLSQGVPMLTMGDEYGQTRLGNNNPWCQDNELNWFLWNRFQNDFFRFNAKLIHFRKSYAPLRKGSFLNNEDIIWHSEKAEVQDWSPKCNLLAFTLIDPKGMQDLYAVFNTSNHPKTVQIPSPREGMFWSLLIDTAAASPHDIYDVGQAPLMEKESLELLPYSALVLVSSVSS